MDCSLQHATDGKQPPNCYEARSMPRGVYGLLQILMQPKLHMDQALPYQNMTQI